MGTQITINTNYDRDAVVAAILVGLRMLASEQERGVSEEFLRAEWPQFEGVAVMNPKQLARLCEEVNLS